MYHALLSKTDYRDKGRGQDRRQTARVLSDLYHMFARKRCILSCITSWLPYITLLHRFEIFLPLEQSRTALLLAASRLREAARWQLL